MKGFFLIWIWVCLLFSFLCFCGPSLLDGTKKLYRKVRPLPPPPPPVLAPVVLLIGDMLTVRAGWSRSDYTMVHESGVSLWISNEAYGLSVEFDTSDPRPNTNNKRKDCMALTDPEREFLWKRIEDFSKLEQKDVIEKFAARARLFADELEKAEKV